MVDVRNKLCGRGARRTFGFPRDRGPSCCSDEGARLVEVPRTCPPRSPLTRAETGLWSSCRRCGRRWDAGGSGCSRTPPFALQHCAVVESNGMPILTIATIATATIAMETCVIFIGPISVTIAMCMARSTSIMVVMSIVLVFIGNALSVRSRSSPPPLVADSHTLA